MTTATPTKSGTTPLMQQYLRIKEKYPSEILFFRLGDFYEMFFDDAIKAAPLLEVALTKRQTIPMCGIPHHAASSYIARLLKAGQSVALAEQLEDPKKTKGMVKRDVVRVITPGTLIEDELLNARKNNFLVAIASAGAAGKNRGQWALAAADISTGQQWIGSQEEDYEWNTLKSHLVALNPSEILFIGDASTLTPFLPIKGVTRFEPVPPEAESPVDQALISIQNYLKRDHKDSVPSLHEPQPLPSHTSGFLFLDETAIRHLELVESADPQRQGPTLLSVLDHCSTPMGSRLMRWWLLHPLVDKKRIEERLNQVDDLIEVVTDREKLEAPLKELADIERIAVRVQTGTASPRDLAALRHSLKTIPGLSDQLRYISESLRVTHFKNCLENLFLPEELVSLLDTKLMENPPSKINQGGVIKDGVNPELDELRGLRKSGKKWVAELELSEREKTGITNLKIGYNDVFGYFLEVSKSHLSKVPSEWIRKQTLTNAERYITPDLKIQEEKILNAEGRILELETQLFSQLLLDVKIFVSDLTRIALAVAQLDVVVSLAEVAAENNYSRPQLFDDDRLSIKGGRHPVIEKQISRDRFIPNDVLFDNEKQRIAVITGPNMAGKSTYLRQTALICIMAQMGSFVPADAVELGLVDRIFTRIGATDRLAQGQSTFMVEMQEVATLLYHATPKSLLVLDEVGRGTSTFDGVSIAWSVIDYLVKGKEENSSEKIPFSPRTLFATHYFELTELADQLPGVFNAHATAKEWPGPDGKKRVIFLYQILPGPADRSYGIHVAEMAGLPQFCIKRSREILRDLESGNHLLKDGNSKREDEQLEFFGDHPIVAQLREINLDAMTPLDAFYELAKLKKKI